MQNGSKLDATEFTHAEFRARRTIIESTQPLPGARLTVFVGLFNSDPYFDHLVEQIEAQTLHSTRWLLVDNDSQDKTWSRVTAWASSIQRDVTLVRNGINLGATGSIFVNMDLVSTEWVTFIHQDDVYLPLHLETLQTAAVSSPPGTVGVFSDMARTNAAGKPIGSFPPPIWMVPDLDPPTVFLSLLRNHCIPWSALAVRSEVFRQTEAPWHSTAFPDTEITMRLAARGRFVHIDKETMRYRDNMASESRSIDDRERKFGATVSLMRVFNSAEFASIALDLPQRERASFATGLRNSILVRLGDTDRAHLVIAAANERLSQLWDDSEPAVLDTLASVYGGLGAAATAGLLDRMSEVAGGAGARTPIAPDPDAVTVTRAAVTVPIFVMRAYERFGPLLPYLFRRALARLVIRTATRNDPLSAWRFEWR